MADMALSITTYVVLKRILSAAARTVLLVLRHAETADILRIAAFTIPALRPQLWKCHIFERDGQLLTADKTADGLQRPAEKALPRTA